MVSIKQSNCQFDIANEKNIKSGVTRLTPQMDVTEIAKQSSESGEEPDWGRVMSEVPKVISNC